ncbi:DNA-invertase hin [Labrenzia sp. THAF82]|uniref:recombinase family protein n=1 Tax=Labrenzia sp. THAF82 TaxID=2587861 RepID=UPI0012689D9C|nr:recombinase family protein [Labrenzia sp. THAF82]QFT29542.1 DNA-invertase hin [Labrenzia sp. THAF82]
MARKSGPKLCYDFRMKIGYARVSTKDQNLDRQLVALKAEGCELVYSEKASGKNTTDRPQLKKALAALNPDDVFVVAEWDRATRSYADGLKILADIGQRGATARVLDRPYFDLDGPLGKALLGLLSAIAEDERQRRLAQAQAGRERAKERGQHLGRKPKLNPRQQAEALKMLDAGKSQREVAAIFGVGRATISRLR